MARMRNSSKLEFRTSPDEPRTRPGDDSPDPVTTYTSLRNVEYCTSLSGYANGGIAMTVLMKAAVFNGPVERALAVLAHHCHPMKSRSLNVEHLEGAGRGTAYGEKESTSLAGPATVETTAAPNLYINNHTTWRITRPGAGPSPSTSTCGSSLISLSRSNALAGIFSRRIFGFPSCARNYKPLRRPRVCCGRVVPKRLLHPLARV